MNQPRRQISLGAAARRLWPLLLPLLATFIVYRNVGDFGFVNFDDDLYVYDNPQVTDGLSWPATRWALTTGHAQVWIPATWLSLQADVSLSGAGPAGFHRTNLALHMLSAALVWLLARLLTGSAAAATLVAALFGVHPLNVEAVAWVTGRKDTLMAPMLLGSVLAWLSLAGRARWPVTFVLAVLAMLAKPAAVVLPGLLLLITLWRDWRAAPGETPRRLRTGEWGLVGSLLAVAAAVAVVTVRLARGGDLGVPLPVSLLQRLADTVTAVGRYLVRLAWPQGLSVRYPEAGLQADPVVAIVVGAALIAATVLLVRGRRRAPLATWGWLWFLLCLAPSSGLVQGGQLPMGDRYVYVGAIGLWIAGAGGLVRAVAARPRLRWPALALGVALTATAMAASARQVEVWRSGESLWRHALAVTRDNDVAHQNLAVLLDAAGRRDDALSHLEASIAIRPRSETLFNAGNVCAALGRTDDAERYYRGALRLNPGLVAVAQNLGSLLGAQGRLDEARAVLLAAAAKRPDMAPLQYNLAVVAWRKNDAAEAALRCRNALALDPEYAAARDLLGKTQSASAPAP